MENKGHSPKDIIHEKSKMPNDIAGLKTRFRSGTKDFLFSYIYYRVTKAYFRWDKRNSITAAISVAMIQSLWPFSLYIFIMIRHSNRDVVSQEIFPKEVSYAWVVVMFFLIFYNSKKYHNKYGSYKKKWKDEPKRKRQWKGLVVLVLMIFPWLFLILASIKCKGHFLF